MKTSEKIVAMLVAALVKNYSDQLNELGSMLPKKSREALIDGYKMGANHGARGVLKMLEVELLP